MKSFHIITLLALVATSCAVKTSYTPTNTPPRPLQAKNPSEVQVFTSALPSRPFTDIGLIKAQERAFSSEGQLIPSMRSQAARVGCDGLVIQGSNNKVVGGQNGVSTREGLWGSCIVWTAPATPSTVAATPSVAPAPKSAVASLSGGIVQPEEQPTQAQPADVQLREQTLRELVREGISLDRLQLGLSLARSDETGVWMVGLIDKSTLTIVSHQQLASLPGERNAAVAHLVIIVRRMVESNQRQ